MEYLLNKEPEIIEKEAAFSLSAEQELFIQKAKEGCNILVNACIGSGKTTAIQHLCNRLPECKKILYLTYNKLLKLDAKQKIKNKNADVTNYHGFAFNILKKVGISVGVPDLIQRFNKEKPPLPNYDVLIIDEYQDIEQELAELLEYVKASNPGIQIIAVGDMEQKIYDKTTLNVPEFIEQFLGEHLKLEFTLCFRLSSGLAEMLGRVWGKQIIGVNEHCIIKQMNTAQVSKFLSEQDPSDILCLGARIGELSATLNSLESEYPNKFNKKTVWASISDNGGTGATTPDKNSAIFTTFDSSKGLERKICVVFDFTEKYWDTRVNKPMQSYEILRNIFCVAASRGKERIIFVHSEKELLSEKTLSATHNINKQFGKFDISDMFNFKYKEDVEKCFALLEIKELPVSDTSVIEIPNKDGLIDISPCIGIYQEAVFFENYSIDTDIKNYLEIFPKRQFLYTKQVKNSSLESKILFLTSLETDQNRYRNQVKIPFISESAKQAIIRRLETRFNKNENVQVHCSIDFFDKNCKTFLFSAIGLADVVKDDTVFELKFVSELTHEHFLQCACYIIALDFKKGILWNTQNNAQYEITVPDKQKFLDAVVAAVTKGQYTKFYSEESMTVDETEISIPVQSKTSVPNYIAVVDTETSWDNDVMSIGIVIADSKTFQSVETKYYILNPECLAGGMFSGELYLNGTFPKEYERSAAICSILKLLKKYNVSSIFAYNASFDCNLLPELQNLKWYDIMRLAAYRQYNFKIPANAECYKTGKLKRGYNVENMVRLLTDNEGYFEKHNALFDALDELNIMRLLGHDISKYKCAEVFPKNNKRSSDYASAINADKSEEVISSGKQYLYEENYGVRESDYYTSDENYNAEKVYTTSEVCGILGISRNRVYSLIHSGALYAEKKKNRYVIRKKDLDNYIERLRKQLKTAAISGGLLIIFFVILIALMMILK